MTNVTENTPYLINEDVQVQKEERERKIQLKQYNLFPHMEQENETQRKLR